jgi:hypothetical protein
MEGRREPAESFGAPVTALTNCGLEEKRIWSQEAASVRPEKVAHTPNSPRRQRQVVGKQEEGRIYNCSH